MCKENRTIIDNSQFRDSSSKLIFGDNILNCQFFRDYADMEILRNIQPEDMEAFANLPDEQVNEILKDTPEYLFSDRSVKCP